MKKTNKPLTNEEKTIINNLRIFREEAGFDQKQLGLKLGYPELSAQQRISNYETGIRIPGRATRQKLAFIFKRDISDFYIKGYIGANEKKTEIHKKYDIVNLAVFHGVPCGEMAEVQSDIKDYLPTSSEMVKDIQHPEINTFWVRVSGNSMEPKIKDGSMVLVANSYADNVVINNGDYVIAVIGDKATLKRIYEKDKYYHLIPDNHEHDPIIIKKKDLRDTFSCLYKVLGQYSIL